MPDRRSPTPEQQSAAFAKNVAEQAVALALAGTEQAQADAVARALRDERVDRDLRDHTARLNRINGSQERFAKALTEMQATVAKEAEKRAQRDAVTEALKKHLENEGGKRISRRTFWIGVLSVVAAYGAIVALILTQH